MKYSGLILVVIGISSIVSAAYGSSHYDKLLIDYDAVDSNYKYTNIDNARMFFNDLNDDLLTKLPLKIDHSLYVLGYKTSPYHDDVTYIKLGGGMDEEVLNRVLSSDFMRQLHCDSFFNNEYQLANDTSVTVNWLDELGYNVGTIEVNNLSCR